jgi:hypothetical protein
MNSEGGGGRGFLGALVVWGLLAQACGGGAPADSACGALAACCAEGAFPASEVAACGAVVQSASPGACADAQTVYSSSGYCAAASSSSSPAPSPDAGATDDAPVSAASCSDLSNCCTMAGFPAAEVGSCIQVANSATPAQCAAALADYQTAGSCGAVIPMGGSMVASTANVSGTVENQTLTARSAVAFIGTATSGGAAEQIVAVEITDRAGVSCADVESTSSEALVGSTLLTLSLFAPKFVMPGTYSVGPAGSDSSAAALWFAKDGSSAKPIAATVGAVTVTSVTGSTLSGSFKLGFGAGGGDGAVSGSFSAAACSPPGVVPMGG